MCRNPVDDVGARPNILFIFPDQWRYDCLSVLGHAAVETPFLDALARRGVLFTHAYTPAATCIPTRAALVSGMSPSQCGRLGYQDGVSWPYDTFMRRLRDGGYQTLCAGKTHFWPARARLGFEELVLYEMIHQDMDHPSDYHIWLHRQTGGRIRDGAEDLDSNALVAVPWPHDENLHPSTWTATSAIELLERRDPTRPFFLQVGFHRPHPPLDPPMSWFARFADVELPPVPVGDWAASYDTPVTRTDPSYGRLPDRMLARARRAYYAQIGHLDYQVGRILRYLKGRKLLNSTWIVFASDHGELLGDHHCFRKTTPFEGSSHVPLMIVPPVGSGFGVGKRVPAVTVHQDLAATFLGLARVASPPAMEGISLLPHVQGEPTSWRTHIHGEHSPCWQFVTDGREKFIWHSVDDRRWFFDLTEDPQELHNLVDEPSHVPRVEMWENRLIETLAARPADGLTDGKTLCGGRSLPAVRPWLLDATC